MNALPCANHPDVASLSPCKGCGRPFCGSCLTELRGEPLCGWCRDTRIRTLQVRQPTDPKAIVLWARIFNGFCALFGAGFSLLMGAMFLLPMVAGGSSGSGTSGTAMTATGALGAVAIAFALLSLAIFLPPTLMMRPGRGWTWTWQLVATALGVLGGVVLIGSFGIFMLGGGIPLFIFWLRPEVRAYLDQGE